MVRAALKPSLRAASCCSVDVMNGAFGRSVTARDSTEATVNGCVVEPRRRARRRRPRRGARPRRRRASRRCRRRSRGPMASRLPSSATSVAGELGASRVAAAANVPSRSQYDAGAERHAGALAVDDEARRRRSARGRPTCAPPTRRNASRSTPRSRRAGRGCAGPPAPRPASCRGRASSRSPRRSPRCVISWNTIRFTGTVRLEHLEQVPRDRLALAVLVGGEVELARVLERGLQLARRRASCRRGRRRSGAKWSSTSMPRRRTSGSVTLFGTSFALLREVADVAVRSPCTV